MLQPELFHRLDDIHLRHHAPLAAIKLASYAADLLHLHEQLRQNVDHAPALEAQLRSICAHWRDPGVSSSLDEPITLIAQVLDHSARSMQKLFEDLAGLIDHQALTMAPGSGVL
jgi:hypothetical protein